MLILRRLENLLLSLWVGVMVGIGYIAAPVLFKVLDDRKLAGSLAGDMFYIVMLVGMILGGILLLLRYREESINLFRQWRGGILLLMLGLVAVSLFVLQPMIAEVKMSGITEGSDNAKKFAMLHGISSLVYLLTVIFGCLLIFFGLRKTPG
ncbi:MAG TPA: DUF4149 domain-containing protein [Gammaproteobacteria bacterium]|nr:DUF4149 domain-containing protein [Gammaproteobacteria bacterium]